MERSRAAGIRAASIVLAFGFSLFLSACGGGSSEGQKSMVLHWNAPTAYQDGTPLTQTADLDVFEIYISPAAVPFSEMDFPAACVTAVEAGSSTVTSSFDLSLVTGELSSGNYRVSVRVLARNGLRSDFSPPVSFRI